MARPRRWVTPLGRWLASYGVDRLLDSLRSSGLPVSRSAAYSWARGRRLPRYSIAREIERLSAGEVSVEATRES